MKLRRSLRIQWVAMLVTIVLLWTVLYPNLFVLADSVREGGRFTLRKKYKT